MLYFTNHMGDEDANEILEVEIWDMSTDFDVLPVCRIRIQDSLKIRFEHEEHFVNEVPSNKYLELKQEIESNQVQEYYTNLGWELISINRLFDFNSDFGEEGTHLRLTFERAPL